MGTSPSPTEPEEAIQQLIDRRVAPVAWYAGRAADLEGLVRRRWDGLGEDERVEHFRSAYRFLSSFADPLVQDFPTLDAWLSRRTIDAAAVCCVMAEMWPFVYGEDLYRPWPGEWGPLSPEELSRAMGSIRSASLMRLRRTDADVDVDGIRFVTAMPVTAVKLGIEVPAGPGPQRPLAPWARAAWDISRRLKEDDPRTETAARALDVAAFVALRCSDGDAEPFDGAFRRHAVSIDSTEVRYLAINWLAHIATFSLPLPWSVLRCVGEDGWDSWLELLAIDATLVVEVRDEPRFPLPDILQILQVPQADWREDEIWDDYERLREYVSLIAHSAS